MARHRGFCIMMDPFPCVGQNDGMVRRSVAKMKWRCCVMSWWRWPLLQLTSMGKCEDMGDDGPPSLVVPLVEDNGCHKIKVAVLLQGVTPSLLHISNLSQLGWLVMAPVEGGVSGEWFWLGSDSSGPCSLGKVPPWRVKKAQWRVVLTWLDGLGCWYGSTSWWNPFPCVGQDDG